MNCFNALLSVRERYALKPLTERILQKGKKQRSFLPQILWRCGKQFIEGWLQVTETGWQLN